MSRSSQQQYRVSFADVSKPLEMSDFAIIRGALGERYGFDAYVINEALSIFKAQDEDLARLKTLFEAEEPTKHLSSKDALNAFLICCLTSAALGEEELGTIKGYDRDEFYTTIRRLYHLVRQPTKKKI